MSVTGTAADTSDASATDENFVKIYQSILDSTVFQEPAATKLVWLVMLIKADANGKLICSIPGLARICGVSIAEVEAALATFRRPDPYSRTKDHDGTRIADIDGGWLILNSRKYRDKRTQRQAYQARWAATKRTQAPVVEAVDTCRHKSNVDTEVEVEGEERSISSSSAAPEPDPHAPFDASEESPSSEPRAPAARDGGDKTRADVAEVFACWQTVHAKQRSKLESKRAARIKARLREGFTVGQLCQAIRGALKDPFLTGADPKASRAFDGIETILRDAAQVERLIALEEGGGKRGPKPPPDLSSEEAWLK